MPSEYSSLPLDFAVAFASSAFTASSAACILDLPSAAFRIASESAGNV